MLNEANSKVQKSKKEIESMDLGEEDIDFASMFEASMKKGKKGSMVEGTIVKIKDDEDSTLVDIGEKQEGLLWKSELMDDNGELLFKEGDKITVVITGFKSERHILSYKKAISAKKVEEFINSYVEGDEPKINAKVISKNRGGYLLEGLDEYEGVEFFLPRSQAYLKESNSHIGKKVEAQVIKVDKDSKSIVVSRKVLIEAQREAKKEIIDQILSKDETINGEIKKITSYGMFVDVGGVDGLVHYSEISYKGPVNPAKLYSEGEVVEVKPISYDEQKRHLSLSIKATTEDPWESLKDELEVGDAVRVVVSNIEPYGAFVDLGNDIEGFLHISEISWDKNIKHPKDYLELDQEIDVEIVEIDFKNRKLRVSLKNVLPKPFDTFVNRYKSGDIVKGNVATVTNFGAFINIGGIDGLLHNEDISWSRGARAKDIFKEGDEVEVKIVSIDRGNEKVSLSKKALEESPIQKFAKDHKNGDIIKAKVRDIKDFGVFVQIDDGVDALIRHEDLGEKKADELEIGEELEAAIVFIDKEKDRIRLSVKRVAKIQEMASLKEYNDDTTTTLGDVLKEQLKK